MTKIEDERMSSCLLKNCTQWNNAGEEMGDVGGVRAAVEFQNEGFTGDRIDDMVCFCDGVCSELRAETETMDGWGWWKRGELRDGGGKGGKMSGVWVEEDIGNGEDSGADGGETGEGEKGEKIGCADEKGGMNEVEGGRIGDDGGGVGCVGG